MKFSEVFILGMMCIITVMLAANKPQKPQTAILPLHSNSATERMLEIEQDEEAICERGAAENAICETS